MSPSPLQKTVLHPCHLELGARMVEFGGWDMPVQYTSILAEHEAVRSRAGLFDISHMGEIRVCGADAARFLNEALSNNVERIAPGQSQYSLLLNDQGGVEDDLFVYAISSREFLLVVNASRIAEDHHLLLSRRLGDVEVVNESDTTFAVALQGPRVAEILDAWLGSPVAAGIARHAWKRLPSRFGELFVARTGYTGEDGFEMLGPDRVAAEVWRSLLQTGVGQGLLPCGLGARDTLRMEVCYPLYGHELASDITPLEAGLGVFVDFQKPVFHGREALLRQKASGVTRKAVALLAGGRVPPPRAGYGLFLGGRRIGTTTSGVMSPSLRQGMALGLLEAEHARIGNSVDIEIRGQYFALAVVAKPVYRPKS